MPPASSADRFAYLPSIYGALLLILLTLFGVYLIVQLQFLIILLFVAALLACTIAGPVGRLEQWGITRALAILIVYALAGGVVAGIGWYVLPRLLGQAAAIAEDLPGQIANALELRQQLLAMEDEYPILGDVDARLLAFAENVGVAASRMLLEVPGAVATGIFSVVTILTFAFMFLMTWRRLEGLLLSLIHPRHREATKDILEEIGNRLGAYLRAKLIIMLIVGVWIYFTMALLGSPYAVIVAIFVGLMEGLPRIGPWIGRAGIVLAALPLGWQVAAIAVVSHVVIDNIKGYVLSPLIEGSQVDIHPLTSFVAVIAGGLLLGWVGAFVAVPAAAIIQVIVEDVLIPWRRRQLTAAGQPPPGTGDGVSQSDSASFSP